MVLPQLSQAETAQVWDYSTILDQLSRVYDNPNKVQEAEDKLFAIRQQPTDSLHAYIAKYERLLYEANGQEWPDANKISTFRNGLNSTIRNRLSQQLNLPRNYSAFLKVVQQLAGRSAGFSHQEHSSTKPSYGNNHANGHTHSHGEPMEINSVNVNTISTHRARSLSPAQRDQLRQDGKCVRCGSLDHWVAHCPLAPFSSRSSSQSPIRGRTTGIGISTATTPFAKKQTGIRQVIAAVYDSDYDSNYISESEHLVLNDFDNYEPSLSDN